MYVTHFCHHAFTEVKFTEENKEAINQAQGNPNGAEITAIDQSFVGRDVVINKSGPGRKSSDSA